MNKKRYLALGYNIPYGINIPLKVKIEDLNKFSNTFIICRCDCCPKISRISYKAYRKNYDKNNLYTCVDCYFENKTQYTNIKKYGTRSTFQNKKVRQKFKNNFLAKYGVENPMHVPEFVENMKQTNLETYGFTTFSQTEEWNDTVKETNNVKFGCDWYMQTTEFIDRLFVNSQNPETHRQTSSAFSIKEYNGICYQGTYELDFLKLMEKYNIKVKKMAYIEYENGDKISRYFPDFYLSSYNLICEIKSSWTMEKDLNKNILKQQKCLDLGYKFIFIINKDYTDLLKLLNIG